MEKIMSTLSAAASTAALLRMFRPRKRNLAMAVLGYAGAFAAGAAVGVVAGLMIAPKSGRQLRADLRSGASEVGGDLRATAEAFGNAARRATHTEPIDEREGAEAAPH